ncbi:MAG: arabinan endo-1,5-alpha-L-arabinosidase [Bacteroidota bacterium]|nr:arabinan endo-1,5-alpha-L-arabinosidase [Bacteroidota bacterium]
MRKSDVFQALVLFSCLFFLLFFNNCKKDRGNNVNHDTTDTTTPPVTVDTTDNKFDPKIADDYAAIADQNYSYLWGSYNLHDPTIIKNGDYYYIFSTDVAYGPNGKCGIMWRKSKDLVHWTFLGWVFNGTIPSIPLAFMQSNQAGYQATGIWAPYIIKVGDQFRLYYSVPGNNGLKLACIALATSTSPEGPWTDQGIVISCLPSDPYNAIDPAVIIDRSNGRQWMSYGSYSNGIYIVELDPATGKRLNPSDRGKRIAYRSKDGDAIEGSDFLYNPELKKYFLFVSYDWLEDKYNVRVGRSDNPEGPYYDINGKDMAAVGDNVPFITAQYQFKNHSGWQGFGHCDLLRLDSANYFYVSQARLGSNKYFMDLHVHRMVWTPSGWPVISPERYANIPQDTVKVSDLAGKWEHIDLIATAYKNASTDLTFNSDNSIAGIANSSWSFKDKVLTLTINGGEKVFSCRVFREWDWENKRRTIVYTGMTPQGKNCWGKKVK